MQEQVRTKDSLCQLLVYGSLKQGHYNYEHHLKGLAPVQKLVAISDYIMLDLGSYPGVVHTPVRGHFTSIRCELYQVSWGKITDDLDKLEGHPSFYHRKEVRLPWLPRAEGAQWGAFMYCLPRTYLDRDGATYVEGGEWLANRANMTLRTWKGSWLERDIARDLAGTTEPWHMRHHANAHGPDYTNHGGIYTGYEPEVIQKVTLDIGPGVEDLGVSS